MQHHKEDDDERNEDEEQQDKAPPWLAGAATLSVHQVQLIITRMSFSMRQKGDRYVKNSREVLTDWTIDVERDSYRKAEPSDC